MSIQRWENCPNLAASTLSPGLSVLVTAASQAPVPDAGKIKTCPEIVLKDFAIRSDKGFRWFEPIAP